jgi:hypothetical protein
MRTNGLRTLASRIRGFGLGPTRPDSYRRGTPPVSCEVLEQRQLLSALNVLPAQLDLEQAQGSQDVTPAATNVGGTISVSTTWTAANGPYNLTSNVTVTAGATLTIEPGVILNRTFNGGVLTVNNEAALIATDVSFNVDVVVRSGGEANIQNSTFVDRQLVVESNEVTLIGNEFQGANAPVLIHSELTYLLENNAFAPGTTVEVQGNVSSPVEWKKLPNILGYGFRSNVTVTATGDLTVAPEVLLNRTFNGGVLTVNNEAALIATDVSFNVDVVVRSGGEANIQNSTFVDRQLVVESNEVTLIGNEFQGANAPVLIHSELTYLLENNAFASGTTVEVQGNVSSPVEWKKLPNILGYGFRSNVTVTATGDLRIAPGIQLTPTFNGGVLTIADNGKCVCQGVIFNVNLDLAAKSAGRFYECIFTNEITLRRTSLDPQNISFVHNDFSQLSLSAPIRLLHSGSGVSTANLSGNFWGTTNEDVIKTSINNTNVNALQLSPLNPLSPGSIGNRVWIDQDGDGNQDPNEPGLPGVGVRAFDALSNAPVSDESFSDSQGNYILVISPEHLNREIYLKITNLDPGFSLTNADADNDYLNSDFDSVTKESSKLTWTQAFKNGFHSRIDVGVLVNREISPAAFRNGYFYLDSNQSNKWDGVNGGDQRFGFGSATDNPVTGDWNNDGTTDVGVFRQGKWYLDLNGNRHWGGVSGGDKVAQFGSAGDLPVTGDWNGDGITDLGVFRLGKWYLDLNGNHKWDGPASTGYFRSELPEMSRSPAIGTAMVTPTSESCAPENGTST